MSYAGLSGMAIGIASLDNSNSDSQTTKALSVIHDVIKTFGLSKDQLEIQKKDAHDIFVDSLDINNPVKAQVSQEKKMIDESQAGVESGKMNAMVESTKSESEILGTNMGESYLLEQPIVEFLKTVTHSLTRY